MQKLVSQKSKKAERRADLPADWTGIAYRENGEVKWFVGVDGVGRRVGLFCSKFSRDGTSLRIVAALERALEQARFEVSGPKDAELGVAISVGGETIFESAGGDVLVVDDPEKWRQLASEIEPWLRKHSGGEFLPGQPAEVDGTQETNDVALSRVCGNALGVLGHEDDNVAKDSRELPAGFFSARGGSENGSFDDDDSEGRALFPGNCGGKLHRAIAAFCGGFASLISRAAGSAAPTDCSGGNTSGRRLGWSAVRSVFETRIARIFTKGVSGFFVAIRAIRVEFFRALEPAASGRRGVSVYAVTAALAVLLMAAGAALLGDRKSEIGVGRSEIDFTLRPEAMSHIDGWLVAQATDGIGVPALQVEAR